LGLFCVFRSFIGGGHESRVAQEELLLSLIARPLSWYLQSDWAVV